MLRGRDRYETMEKYSIVSLFFGALILSLGIALTAFSPAGIPAILTMLGAFIAFIATITLIISWLLELFRKEPGVKE